MNKNIKRKRSPINKKRLLAKFCDSGLIQMEEVSVSGGKEKNCMII